MKAKTGKQQFIWNKKYQCYEKVSAYKGNGIVSYGYDKYFYDLFNKHYRFDEKDYELLKDFGNAGFIHQANHIVNKGYYNNVKIQGYDCHNTYFSKLINYPMPEGEIITNDESIMDSDDYYHFIDCVVSIKQKDNSTRGLPLFTYRHSIDGMTNTTITKNPQQFNLKCLKEELDWYCKIYDVEIIFINNVYSFKKSWFLKEMALESMKDGQISKQQRCSVIGIFAINGNTKSKDCKKWYKKFVYPPAAYVIWTLSRLETKKLILGISKLGKKWLFSITDSVFYEGGQLTDIEKEIITKETGLQFGNHSGYWDECVIDGNELYFFNIGCYGIADSDGKKLKITHGLKTKDGKGILQDVKYSSILEDTPLSQWKYLDIMKYNLDILFTPEQLKAIKDGKIEGIEYKEVENE